MEAEAWMVMLEDETFIHIIPQDVTEDELRMRAVGYGPSRHGKWVIYAPREKMRRIIVPHVTAMAERRIIHHAKYVLDRKMDSIFSGPPMMCVYSSVEKKDEVLRWLLEGGISPERWKLDSETQADWAPGGKFGRTPAGGRTRYNRREYITSMEKERIQATKR